MASTSTPLPSTIARVVGASNLMPNLSKAPTRPPTASKGRPIGPPIASKGRLVPLARKRGRGDRYSYYLSLYYVVSRCLMSHDDSSHEINLF